MEMLFNDFGNDLLKPRKGCVILRNPCVVMKSCPLELNLSL